MSSTANLRLPSSILEKIVSAKREQLIHEKSRTKMLALKQQARDMPPAKDFLGALQSTSRNQVALIAEVKKASPSKGIIRENFDPVEIAKIYAAHGAACISVLTDEPFFQGKLEYLQRIRQAVDVPLLRKDFIIDEFQIVQARAAGADAVLLIAECLTPEKMIELHQMILEWGMIPLVELYDPQNVDAVLACQPKLVGVNNRDLNTFDVDLNHSINVKQQLPADVMMVSESGITTPADVRRLEKAGVQAMLVGESLMRQDDIAAAVRKLLG